MKHTLLSASLLTIALLTAATALTAATSSALNAASVTGLVCLVGLAIALLPIALAAGAVAGYKIGRARAAKADPIEHAHTLPNADAPPALVAAPTPLTLADFMAAFDLPEGMEG